MENEPYRVCVLGAGLTGVYSSILFAQMGFQVTLVDKEDIQTRIPLGSKPNSSIIKSESIVLTRKGLLALKEADVLDATMVEAVRMSAIFLHKVNSYGSRTLPINPDTVMYSILQSFLHTVLLEAACSAGVKAQFGMTLVDCSDHGTCTFDEDGCLTTRQTFDLIVDADGTHSQTRSMNFNRRFLPSVSRTLRIPPLTKRIATRIPGSDVQMVSFENEHAVEPGVHVWTREESRLVVVPNADCSCSATLITPLKGRNTITATNTNTVIDYTYLPTAEQVLSWLNTAFPSITTLVPDFYEQYTHSEVQRLTETRTNACNFGNIVLLGNAAHTLAPVFGGIASVNVALWDALTLHRILQKHVHARRVEKANALAYAAAGGATNLIDGSADSSSASGGSGEYSPSLSEYCDAPADIATPAAGASSSPTIATTTTTSTATISTAPQPSDPQHILTLRALLTPADLQHSIAEYARLRQRGADALADLCMTHYTQHLAPHSVTLSAASYLQRNLPWYHYLQQYLHYTKIPQVTNTVYMFLRHGYETLLRKVFPKYFLPLYERILFTEEPYEVAIEQAGRQEKWVGLLVRLHLCVVGIGTSMLVYKGMRQ